MQRGIIPILFFIFLMPLVVYAYDATDTGYFLPKGYKVTGRISVPGPPFWPGENLGDIVGLATNEYSILIIGYGYKGGVLEGFAVEQGIKVVWKEAGREEVKAKVPIQNVGEHDVTIVYTYDGEIKISVDGRFIYGFVATSNKYQIVAQGARVDQPHPLPRPDDNNDRGDNDNNDVGEGYDPPSVPELQIQYLLLGALAMFILIFLLKRR